MHKKPWFWVAISWGLIMLIVPLGIAAWLIYASMPQDTGDAICVQRFDTTCTDVKPEAIADAADMTLPEGTVVEHSRYQQFQDWHLEARFVIPADAVAEWEASLDNYEPATQCPQQPDGVLCAERIREQGDPWGSYRRLTRDDASLEVTVEVFTT